MNFRKSRENRVLTAIVVLFAATMAGPAGAAEHGISGEHRQSSRSGLTYTSQVFGPAIHSYRNIEGSETDVRNPTVIAVSQASGPAIYSYPRLTRDTAAALAVDYVDSAYGPAIYSYPYPGSNEPVGEVRVLPVVTD